MYKKLFQSVKDAFSHAAPGPKKKEHRLGEVVDSIGLRTNSRLVTVAGAAAGDVAVAGIEVGDEIESVIRFNGGVPSILTAEFSIKANGTINNTGGTVTTGSTLLVTFLDLTQAA